MKYINNIYKIYVIALSRLTLFGYYI